MNRETAITFIRDYLAEAMETDIPAYIACMAMIAAIKGNYGHMADRLTGYSRRDYEEAVSILRNESDSITAEAVDFINTYLLEVSATASLPPVSNIM